MANQKFSTQVDEIITTVNERMMALIQQSVQDVIDIAQEPGLSKATVEKAIKRGIKRSGPKRRRSGPIENPNLPGKGGGKMPVDTGFLRASGQLSLNGMPQGPIRGDPNQSSYEWDRDQVELTLSGVEIGDTLFFGWSAIYANKMETYYGFLASAVQRWNEIVAKNAAEIIRRIS